MGPYVASERSTDVIPSHQVFSKPEDRRVEPIWVNVIFFAYVHALSVYGFYLAIFEAKWQTLLWTFLLIEMTAIGVTAGAHRLWSHRSYKAKWPVQLFLTICFTIGHQKSIYKWVRDHRVHHKCTDSDGDPHNIRRGVFFAHIGWILCKKLPLTIMKGNQEDLSDLKANSIVMFQHRHYFKVASMLSFIIPTFVPMYFWNEGFLNSLCVATAFRYVVSLHRTFLINSAAHLWGNKPYDKSICAVNNRYIFPLTMGEGWHNYHHVFPWDYRSVELACTYFNFTTFFIDAMAACGLVYDRKIASQELVKKRMARTGDNSEKHVIKLSKCEVRILEEEEEKQCLMINSR